MAECVHAIPGRARFRVPALRHSDTLARALANRLNGIDGVRHVEVRRQAASLVVHFDPLSLDAGAVHQVLLGDQPADLPPPPPPRLVAVRRGEDEPTGGSSRPRRLLGHVSAVAGAAALNVVLERAVKAGIGVLLRSARIPI